MDAFPRIALRTTVPPEDHASAIDFVNRVNWLFETWDVDAMVNAFLPEGTAYHFHGVIRGQKEMRSFFDNGYPYLVPGVSRHATNHIVDADDDGVVVRYHNLLVRHAEPHDAPALLAGHVMESKKDLPGIWIYSPMRDRLRRTSDGWRIFERYVGGSTTNSRMTPKDTSAEFFAPYLPRPK